MLRNKMFGLAVLLVLLSQVPVLAAASDYECAVYFTGIGCSHCAQSDPVLFKEVVPSKNLVVIEYEIYQKQVNAPLLSEYYSIYDGALGVPQIILDQDTTIVGDRPVINAVRDYSKVDGSNNACPGLDGLTSLEEMNFNWLEGQPTIWRGNRVMIKESGEVVNNALLHELLFYEDIMSVLEGRDYELVDPVPVRLSGTSVSFDEAVKVGGWRIQWRAETGAPVSGPGNETVPSLPGLGDLGSIGDIGDMNVTGGAESISLVEVVSLAAVDAVNPCALAVLTMMLVSIITYNPKDKTNLLLAGLAFTASVFVMYLFYGLVIVKFFQLVQAITSIRLILYKVLAVMAIVLGILEIKDFVDYSPGGFATEMPMSLRPHVKKIISSVTSPSGAFGVGAFVTVFLLPCTVGPYVIVGGMLSVIELLSTIPLLVLYNLIFVLPMLFITILVYFGISRVEDVSEWREENIRKLHLVSGIIILGLGVAMLLGWV